MDRIGFEERFYAVIMDTIVLMPIGYLTLFLFQKYLPGIENYFTKSIIWSAFGFFYSTFEIFKARTPGKMIVKIIIRNQDGSIASYYTLIFRWMLKYLDNLFFLIFYFTRNNLFMYSALGIGIIITLGCFLALGELKQALHDRIAKTAVFSTKEIHNTV